MKILCIILFFLISISGCEEVKNEQDADYQESETRSWSAQNISFITTITINGEITVTAGTEDTISARITRKCSGKNQDEAKENIKNIVITETLENGRLTLEADMPQDGSYYEADFEITAPASIQLGRKSPNPSNTSKSFMGTIIFITNTLIWCVIPGRSS